MSLVIVAPLVNLIASPAIVYIKHSLRHFLEAYIFKSKMFVLVVL